MADFYPKVYVREDCPFCMKLRIFLLEAGLLENVQIVQGHDEAGRQRIADHLVENTGKASFPTAEIAPGVYIIDSDAIISHFEATGARGSANLPTLQAYARGILPRYVALFKENIALRSVVAEKELGEAAT